MDKKFTDTKDSDEIRLFSEIKDSAIIRDHFLSGKKDDVFVIVPEYPMHVLGTSVTNGGERRGVRYIFNRSIDRSVECEADLPGGSWIAYMELTSKDILSKVSGIPDISGNKKEIDTSAVCGLSTAALMKNTGFGRSVFRIPETDDKIEVVAIATGGVDSNACRAGDSASYYEWNGSFYMSGQKPDIVSETSKSLKSGTLDSENPNADNPKADNPNSANPKSEMPKPGTINIFVLIGAVLTPGALARAIITATEAKTTVLEDFAIPSRFSSGFATGTGTDGVIVASIDSDFIDFSNSGKFPFLTDTTHHAKLGEIICLAVRKAVSDALFKETGLSAARQKTVLRRLERFGVRKSDLENIFENDSESFMNDGAVIGFVSSVCRLKDEVDAGLISENDAMRAFEFMNPYKNESNKYDLVCFNDNFGKSMIEYLKKIKDSSEFS